ncbi:MAG TPA: LuxR C-terminal-related transcriptional regulator [Geobacteraceae bacterium]
MILGISERTVKYHVSTVMSKLDASNRSHAVAIALSMGLIAVE